MIIRSRAPVRISFGGGGTDVPPYCDERGGCVLSATIDKYSHATLESRNDQEIHLESADFLRKLTFGNVDEIKYNNDLDLLKAAIKRMNTTKMGINVFMRTDVPPKSGLGSSASAFVSLIGLFNHLREKKMIDYEIAEFAYKIEREELNIAGGRQDQYATVFGGLNYIEFGNNWVRVNPLKIKKEHLLELEKHIVLAYTKDRPSAGGDILADQTKSVVQKKEDVINALDKMKMLAEEMKNALLIGDFVRFGELLHEAWESKKKFSSMITDRYINDIYDLARKAGAIGGKITGAGGGGFMLFLCKPNKEHIVTKELGKKGIFPIPFGFDWEGLQTWEVNYLSWR